MNMKLLKASHTLSVALLFTACTIVVGQGPKVVVNDGHGGEVWELTANQRLPGKLVRFVLCLFLFLLSSSNY